MSLYVVVPSNIMITMIRCYECKWFKGIGKAERSGWCKNPAFPKSVRCDAVDYCDKAEKKEAE